MHLVVDCRSIHSHMGGIGRAALELVRHLGAHPRSHRISMIVAAGRVEELSVPGVHIVPVDAAMIDERFEQMHLPSLLQELCCDVYLNTTFSVPAVRSTKVQLSIVHDVVFEDRPEFVEPWLQAYLSRWSRFAAGHADHVLTVSDHAKSRIESVYGTPSSRVTRVYNGVASSCFEPPDDREVARVRAKFGLTQPFILYLGTLEIKKGVAELVKAFRRATEAGLVETLVLAGGKGGPEFDIDSLIRQEHLADRIRLLGFVEEMDKKPLLKASSLFVYPSLYEGFGIPPLEAMALGVPTVTSDQTSLPEVVGNAALVAPVREPEDFSRVLKQGVQDSRFRKASGVDGPAQARTFNWDNSAARVLDLCERLEAN